MNKIDNLFDPILDQHYVLMSPRFQTTEHDNLSYIEKLKSYGTVRLDIGRQTGKSSYIARTARREDIIFTLGVLPRDTMQERCRGFGLTGCDRVYVFNVFKLDVLSVITDVENVWIDDASNLTTSDLDKLYEAFAGKCRRFILIG